MFAPFDAAVRVAYHLVSALAAALHPFAGGLGTALAIVVFTVAVRLALHPLARRQAAADRARLALAPQAEKLRRRHQNDPVRAHQEVTALYRANGTSMFAGIGPALLQVPVFSVVYRLFLSPAIGGHANLLLARSLFGVPLGERWLFASGGPGGFGGFGGFGPHCLVFFGLFALLATVAWWTSRRMSEGSTPPPGLAGRIVRLLPFGTVAVAAYVPLAAGLYLLTSTTWAAVERAILWRGTITT